MRGGWLGLTLLGGVLGCAGVSLRPGALDEAARVERMALSFGADGTGGLHLLLDVKNPTLWDAKVTGVDFELRLDGRRYTVGTRGASLLLGSGGRSSVWVFFPLRSTPTREEGRVRPWRVEVDGTVVLAFGEMSRRLPFHTETTQRLMSFKPLEAAPE